MPDAGGQDRPKFQAVDPANNQPGRAYDGHTTAEALQIVEAAGIAHRSWRQTTFEARGGLMRAAADVLRRRKSEYAALMAAEMGKSLKDGEAEVEKCAAGCEFYAEHAARFLADELVDLGGPQAKVVFRPLGVVLAVMPWNFPFWQVFRFAAPTLMAGNTAVLKHASNVPGCALAIESVFAEAGFPADVFRSLLVPSSAVQPVIEHPAVAAVSLTGSVAAGRKVASQAGAVLKKCVLELGGSDAYLVLDDADIAAAAKVAAAARLVNAGQSCVAGKRFIALAAVRERFEPAFVQEMQAQGADLAPLVSVAARDEVHAQVQRSLDAGARLLCGGEIPPRSGAWYPPTVLTGVRPGMPVYDEEVFGPVAAIIEAADEAEAVRIANDSEFGLGSGVLTGDLARGERLAADALEAGMSFVNANVRSDPRLPFGGIKHSGFGRELSAYGLREFVNAKTVVVHPEAKASAQTPE
jgi:succinate-semialdehyde dehydrogenase / glutarate-semialdehyde dehydrogenase